MEELKDLLISKGANLVGFANLNGLNINNDMPFGVSVVVKLSPEVINSIQNGPNMLYFEEYHRINNLLNDIVTVGTEYITKNGFKALAQITTTVKYNDEYRTKLPHKTVATKAGIGWIGKCGCLVTNEYGSGVRISSFLTNAKLECGIPIEKSFCGNCMECVINCPANAVSGKLWNVNIDRDELIDVYKCRDIARKISMEKIGKEATICGKCFAVCPYTIKSKNM